MSQSKYRGVSAAEKRQAYEIAGLDWPSCGCHGELMYWFISPSSPLGGRWQCSVRSREYKKRYKESARGRSTYAKYKQSATYKANKRKEIRKRPPRLRVDGFCARCSQATESYRCPSCVVLRNASRQKTRDKKRLLLLLPKNLWMVEKNWPKAYRLAKLAIGGTTTAERDSASHKLDLVLQKEGKPWLTSMVISAAMQTMRVERSVPLSLASSNGG